MSWLKAIGIGLDLADAYIAEQNAKKLKELQMQGAAIALIEALIKELRNQIFNFKQTAEAILVDESETPVIAAGAMKLLERRLLESGITPDVFQEITDKEYTAAVIRLIRENSDRMLRGLSKEEQVEINHVASVASRLQDYEFYVENYQKGKELQKATEVVATYKNRQGCLPIVGLILYFYPGIAFPFLFAVMLGGGSDAGQSIVGFIGLGLWTWGLIGILKWKNGGGYKDANNVIKKHGEDFNLAYFNSLEKELGDVQEIKKRHNEARRIAGNFFGESSLLQFSPYNPEENSMLEQPISINAEEDANIETIEQVGLDKDDTWSAQHIILEANPRLKVEGGGVSTNHSPVLSENPEEIDTSEIKEEYFSSSLPISTSQTNDFDLEKYKDIALGFPSTNLIDLRITFSNILSSVKRSLQNVLNKFKAINLPFPKKKILYGILGGFIITIGIIIYSNLTFTTESTSEYIDGLYTGVPIPSSNTPIDHQNINKISVLAQWEQGNAVKFSPDGNLIVIASPTGIRIHNSINFEEVNFINTKTSISDVIFSPKGDFIVASSSTGVFFYNSTTFDQVNLIQTNYPVVNISYSPDGKNLTILTEREDQGLSSYAIEIWNVDIGKLIFTVENIQGVGIFIDGAEFSPDGKILATSHGNNPIQLWGVEDGLLLNTLNFPSRDSNGAIINSIRRIFFYPNGQFLAAETVEGNILVWDIYNGSLLSNINKVFDSLGVKEFSFSPDNQFLAITTSRSSNSLFQGTRYIGEVQIFPTGEWEPISILETYGANTSVLAFSPDGQILATSGDWDTVIQLWRFSDGLLLQTLKGHNDLKESDFVIDNLSFSPDGTILASRNWGGTVRLWGIAGEVSAISPTSTSTSMPIPTSTSDIITDTPTIVIPSTSTAIPANTLIPTQVVCANFTSQLKPNIEAIVITDAINVREKPGTNQTIVGIIYKNDKVQITIEPPICGDGYLWWKVQAIKTGVIGWAVEGVEGERWLSP